MYFKLNPECLFVVGKNGSIICDSFNNKIYHLNKNETNLLINAERNNKISSNEFFNDLEKECLGTFYENLPYIPKLRNGIITYTDDIEFKFKKFFLEINSECINNCSYCGNKKDKRSLGCLGCNIFKEEGNQLTLIEFKEIVDSIHNLGCEELYLTGGDLSLDENMVLKVLDYAKGKFNKIHLIISYKNISKRLINNFNKYYVELIIQIDLYDFKPENLFENNNITYLVVVPEDNENIFYDNFKDMPKFYCIPDFLTKEKLYNPNLNNNFDFTIDSFFHNLEFHPCLGKTLFISSRGNVYPCPMLRTKLWGNIKQESLLKLLQKNKNQIYEFWRRNLDFIEGCKDCEFRYLCIDCRVLEEELTKKSNSKNLCSLSGIHG